MFYFKSLLLVFWFLFCSCLGIVYSLIFWGNKNLNQKFARVFSWGVLRIAGIRIELEGKEYIESQKPAVYVANHQSGLDMATLGGFYPSDTVVIGKKEVAWIPLFGLFYMAAGNVLINRKKTAEALSGLTQVVDAIKTRKVSIWIFPEGTRNTSGEGLLPFKKGAFHMAIQAKVPIIPFVCGPLQVLMSWKGKRLKSGVLKVRILPPISTVNLTANDVEMLAQETRRKMLEALRGLIS